jgi:uncharacterized protein
MINFYQSLSGFLVGIIVGLTGVGGGSLMTPLLVLLFGIHPVTAVGTDLLQAAITKAGGTFVHSQKKRIDWRVTALLATGSLPSAIITMLALHAFTNGLGSAKIITTTLGIALMLTAVALALRSRMWRYSQTRGRVFVPRHPGFTIATGAILGVLVSLSSVGAGALGLTALVFLYPQLAAQRIVASDLAHAVPLTLIAGMGHWYYGDVDWALLLSLLVGSLPGIYIGSHLVGYIPERILRLFLVTMLLLIGVRLLVF